MWVAELSLGRHPATGICERRHVTTVGRGWPGEIFYISLDREVMAVWSGPHRTEYRPRRRPLFKVDNLVDVERRLFPSSNAYVSTADGQRFLMASRVRRSQDASNQRCRQLAGVAEPMTMLNAEC